MYTTLHAMDETAGYVTDAALIHRVSAGLKQSSCPRLKIAVIQWGMLLLTDCACQGDGLENRARHTAIMTMMLI